MSGKVMLFSSAAFLFMLLLTCRGSGGVVCAEKGETRVSESGKDVSSFSANSNCESDHESCCSIGIWSKPLKYEKDKLPSEVIKTKDGSQCMAQAAVTKKTNESYCTQLFGPSAVVKDNKIYILLSNFTTPKVTEGDGSNALWDLELVVGTVATPTGDSPNRITWDPSKSLKDTLKDKLPDGSSWDELRVIGRGIVMGGSTILFPLALQNINRGGNGACTVIYSEDDGKNWNFPSKNAIDKDCERATLLEWEGKLLMIPTSPSSRTREVYVSADKGKTWTEYTEADSNLLIDFLKRANVDDIYDVIPATISGRNVTLLTQRRFIPSGKGRESPNKVHLLMTDNKRITSMGPLHQDAGIASVCKLLLTKENGELFALCDKGPRDSAESVVRLSLTEQLGRISSVLEFWEIADGRVSNICIYATQKAPCRTMPTSGLVGFLSNTDYGTQWFDEYLGVSATVTGGTKVGNGFKLSGTGASIEWEVGNDPPTPRYSFAYRGLTLVATVTIHDIPKSGTPLMSVGFASKAVGLWYGKENHWKGLSGEEEVATGTWEKDKPYQVVIRAVNGTVSVYIDGKRLGGLDPNFQPNEDGMRILNPQPAAQNEDYSQPKEELKRICFGGCASVHDGDVNTAASSFTVTNVFLYNRVLSEDELPPPPPPPPPPPAAAAPPPPAAPAPAAAAAAPAAPATPEENDSQLKEEVRDSCLGECVPVHDGDESNAASSFTVTNVSLQDRVLSEDEIGAPEAGVPDTEAQQEVSSSEKASTISEDQPPTTNSTTQHSVTEGGTVQMSKQEVPSIDEGERKSHSETLNPQQVTNNIPFSPAALLNKSIRSDDGFAYVQVGGMLLLLPSMQLFGLLVS